MYLFYLPTFPVIIGHVKEAANTSDSKVLIPVYFRAVKIFLMAQDFSPILCRSGQ